MDLMKELEKYLESKRDHVKEEECDHKYVYDDDGTLVCRNCFTEKVRYVMPFIQSSQIDSNCVVYFKKLLSKFDFHKYIEKEILRNFCSFGFAYENLKNNWNRKSFISYELVLYCILNKMDCDHSLNDFDNINYNHIPICRQVLKKLGWENIFLPYNKMEKMELMKEIINDFTNRLLTLNESLDRDKLNNAVEHVVKPYVVGVQDVVDGNCLVSCKYIHKKGKSKGLSCTVKVKNQEYCHKHRQKKIKENEN